MVALDESFAEISVSLGKVESARLAREMLLNSELDIENVAIRAGFASARQFRRVWQRIYNEPPSRVRLAV